MRVFVDVPETHGEKLLKLALNDHRSLRQEAQYGLEVWIEAEFARRELEAEPTAEVA